MSRKLYSENHYLTNCISSVKEVTEEGVIFHQTVAYPEGGTQIGDIGVLKNLLTGEKIKFKQCKKVGGRKSTVPEFQGFLLDAQILHHISQKDLKKFKVGEKWIIEIDWKRRAKINANHTGTHLLFLGVTKVRTEIEYSEKVAKITDEYGRIDFTKAEKFSLEEIKAVENFIQEMINQELEIGIASHSEEKEVFYWNCNGELIPCEGTHIHNTNLLKSVNVERKSIEGKETLVATFEHSEELFKNFNK